MNLSFWRMVVTYCFKGIFYDIFLRCNWHWLHGKAVYNWTSLKVRLIFMFTVSIPV